MHPSDLARQLAGPGMYGLATGFALSALSVSHGGGPVGVVSAIGVGVELAGLPLLTMVSEPPPPYAVGLANYRRPSRLPSARIRMVAAAVLVAIMVTVTLLLPAWYGLVLMLVAGAGLVSGLMLAWRVRRNRTLHRERIHRAVAQYRPRFVIYTGRGSEGSYQLAMWVPILERLHVPYLVVLRHADAVGSTRTVTGAPVVVCPAGGDLDSIMVDGLRAAFYVNAVAENSTFVEYRGLIHIYLGHGDSDKELSIHPMHAMFDRVVVAGQAAIDRYEQAGVAIPQERFVRVGRPQLAPVSAADCPISAVERPRVLYAPTWRGYNAQTSLSSLPWGIKIVSALLIRGVPVTFSPHPFSWQGSQERGLIGTIDQVLRRDRETAGTPHRLAGEIRGETTIEQFDESDALITDIGSVLVDYFVTDKPYGVVLPPARSADTVRSEMPSTAAAYLLPAVEIDEHGTDALTPMLDDLLRRDPMHARRRQTARYFLGDTGGDDRPFLAAVRALLDDASGRDRV